MERRHFEKKMEGNCIILGLKLNENGRKLLDFTLNVIAKEGDRIFAVHVCKKSQSSVTNTSALIEKLGDFLAEFESLCSEKKVILVGRVSTAGNSVEKVLVNEAKLCAAITLIVGVNKTYSFGGSSCVAKYCAKHLPATTTIIAVQKGNIIFQRKAPKIPQGTEPKPTLRTVLHPNIGMDPKVIIPNPERSLSDISKPRRANSSEKIRNDSIINIIEQKQRLGWPLLRTQSNLDSQIKDVLDSKKLSVVQWVMNLPKRNPQLEDPWCEFSKELKRIIEENDSNRTCKWLCYKYLLNSTNKFSSDNLIGKGGAGDVYKGCLQNGEKVAIKVSKLSPDSTVNFQREVEIITKLKHDHIVPLIGICVEDNSLISVYNYFSKGSLEDNLHGVKGQNTLNWEKRFKISIDIASAINYLHNGSDKPVIHKDVKSLNILLTDEYEAKLSDFGLAIWAPSDSSSIMDKDVLGTFGYLAPEYFMYGKVSNKIDVYAFGVVLLELLTGRKCISENTASLVMWATPILKKGDINELLDPNLVNYDESELKRMILAASLCMIQSARLRPQMNQILGLLKGEEKNINIPENETDDLDDEIYPVTNKNVISHLELALMDIEDVDSPTSTEESNPSSFEEYLKGRWSRSSSFD